MTTHRDDDMPRDAHLLAALRHAPDREAAPPPEVTARILAAARAAVRAEAAPTWPQRFAAWWHRPQLAAAFGTLVAAVLVGMLWSTREPLPPSEPPAPVPVRSAPDTSRDSAAVPAEQRAAASDAMRQAAPAAAPTQPTQPAAPPPARSTERTTERSPSAEPRAAKSDGRAPREKQSTPAAAMPAREPAPTPAPARGPAQAPAPAPAAAPTTSPDGLAGAGGLRAPEAATSKAGAEAAQEQAAAGAPMRQRPAELGRLLSRREDANAASTPADARLAAAAARAAPADPLTSLDALLLGPPDAARATWRHAARTPAHGAAQQTWWRELRAATQGRWQALDAAPQAFAPWLTLAIDGHERARWWLQGEHVVLADAQGRTWRAPLSASQAQAWSEAIAGW